MSWKSWPHAKAQRRKAFFYYRASVLEDKLLILRWLL